MPQQPQNAITDFPASLQQVSLLRTQRKQPRRKHGAKPDESNKSNSAHIKVSVKLGTYDRGGFLFYSFGQTLCRRHNKNKKAPPNHNIILSKQTVALLQQSIVYFKS